MTKRRPRNQQTILKKRQRLLELHQRQVSHCRLCVEAGYIEDALPIFHGTAASRVMVVGQAPAAPNIERELPYCGATGQTLQGWLERAGFQPGALHANFYLTSLTKCFPGSHPTGKETVRRQGRDLPLHDSSRTGVRFGAAGGDPATRPAVDFVLRWDGAVG